MKSWLPIAIAVAALALCGSASARSGVAQAPIVAQLSDMSAATDFSSRQRHDRRIHRHHRWRHQSRLVYQPSYYERPTYYRPYRGLTPFFPFGLGYGLEPSW